MATSTSSPPSQNTTALKDLSTLSHEDLVARVVSLEKALRASNECRGATSPRSRSSSAGSYNRKPSSKRSFDPSKYSTRYIALKFAYLGKKYNGLEWHDGNDTPLPTVEEELWKALAKARLIMPEGGIDYDALARGTAKLNWQGLQYSKCGRTDKGVSAFGQVVGIRVRSNRPVESAKAPEKKSELVVDALASGEVVNEFPSLDLSEDDDKARKDFDHIVDELPYPQLLNRLLPPDIRVLAWCPSPPNDFDARFSCRERRYRYFFTNPIFAPSPLKSKAEEQDAKWLDIDAMSEAAKSFVGLHDFRNFCKIDASKQITNFKRRIFKSEIERIDPLETPAGYICDGLDLKRSGAGQSPVEIYSFTVHGSAFLWHQIRHMVAILFLIGQKVESVSIVKELMNIAKYPGKPAYDKASDAPLVLWDCIFPTPGTDDEFGSGPDSLEWVDAGDSGQLAGSISAPPFAVDELWAMWQERKIDELLAGSLLDVIARSNRSYRSSSATAGPQINGDIRSGRKGSATSGRKLYRGSNVTKATGHYVPICRRAQLASPEEVNRTYRLKHGLPEPGAEQPL